MTGIVRQSHYRHVFGTAAKQEFCYQNLRPTTSAWDSDFVKANGQFFAIPWQGGGGSIAVFKLSDPQKFKPDYPTLSGHQAQILDFDFHPFNEHILASGSLDGTVKIWQLKDVPFESNIKDAAVTLEVEKKAGLVKFHPTSNNVLLYVDVAGISLVDIETGKVGYTCKSNQMPQSVSFNKNASLFAAHVRDKKLRIFDPRQGKAVAETDGHTGVKGARTVWLPKLDKVFTVGFNRAAERHIMIFDPRKLESPIIQKDIDSSASLLMPFYDEDTSIMYLAGKGDSNIRYYELVDDDTMIHEISIFKSSEPQRGMASVPKYALNVPSCEVARLLKLEKDQVVPISFVVPRKSTVFQSDIYPDTRSFEPAQSAADYFAGKDVDPVYMSMKPSENKYKHKTYTPQSFEPKVVEKPKKVELPKETNDPRELKKQNEELRKLVDKLSQENVALKQKIQELEAAQKKDEAE